MDNIDDGINIGAKHCLVLDSDVVDNGLWDLGPPLKVTTSRSTPKTTLVPHLRTNLVTLGLT